MAKAINGKPKPMTVTQMCDALAKQPGTALLAWIDWNGKVGYFYEDEQEMDVDNGHVHIELGPAG